MKALAFELTAELRTGGLVSTEDVTVSYTQPEITSVSWVSAPTDGGANITIDGTNFGPSSVVQTASIGTTACQSVVWMSQSQVICTSPAGAGRNLGVTVSFTKCAHAVVIMVTG